MREVENPAERMLQPLVANSEREGDRERIKKNKGEREREGRV